MNWMPKWALTSLAGTAFALTLCLTAISSANAQDKKEVIKKAQTAITTAGAALAKGDDSKVAEVEKFDLDPIMAAFKPRMRGGIGFGEKAGLVPPNEDGIESKLMSLGKKALSPADAGKFQGAVSDLAYNVLAIGKATDAKWPESKDKSKSKDKWLEFNAIMKEGATELGEAAKAKDGAKIKAAAAKINRSCNECHTVFRD